MKTVSVQSEKKVLLRKILKSVRVKEQPELADQVKNFSLQGLRDELKRCETHAKVKKFLEKHNKY